MLIAFVGLIYDGMSFVDETPSTPMAMCRNCGIQADVSGGKFCPTCGWSTADEAQGVAVGGEVSCPVCWTPNPGSNRHCEQCAARLGNYETASVSRGAVPPQRTALYTGAAIAVVIVSVVVIANGAEEGPVAQLEAPAVVEEATLPTIAEESALVEATESPRPATPVDPISIDVSSELSADFGPGLLTDGDLSTAWNDGSLHGEGAVLTFRFEIPVTIDSMVISNLDDSVRFIRNYRVRGYAISIDGQPALIRGELEDTQDPQIIDIGGSTVSVITFNVVSTYSSETVDAGPGFEELAIAEVRFVGR